jgi:outer membrane protein assembly factor BamC
MMQLNVSTRTGLLALIAVLLLNGCGTADKVAPGRKVDYRKSDTTAALEVPPDLSSTTINEAPAMVESISSTRYQDADTTIGKEAVLPASDAGGLRVERDGDQQWLVIQETPSQVWPRVREFWMQEGFLLKLEDPRVGIIETGWTENRADIPQGLIRNTLGKVIDVAYSAATRDQYRVRLEAGAETGTTELFLTHRGVEEVVTGPATDANTVWKPRPTDPELEAEMLKRLMVYLGVEQQKAQTMLATRGPRQERAQLVADDTGAMLVVNEGFSRAWRRTGVALDRVGFAVEDRNRAEGIYYVRYSDPLATQDDEGLLSGLAFWSKNEVVARQYQIELLAEGSQTHVIVNDAKGNRETSSTGKRILTLLEEQLR